MKRFLLILLIAGSATACTMRNNIELSELDLSLSIPTVGNSWVLDSLDLNRQMIGDSGIVNWTEPGLKIRTYFKTELAGNLDIALVSSNAAKSVIATSFGDEQKHLQIAPGENDTIAVGHFKIVEPGYHYLELEGISREGESFPDISEILIGGEATGGKVWFVKDEFYWGRRGPSVHLAYQVPEQAGDVLYFYNEITVPENNDVLGSYYMANGFSNGYFGIQVNSPEERRVLFSVWSPFHTDDPNEIPDDQKIEMLKKGEGVYTGEFGNEGSGGQSFYHYMWKAGTTYRFLLKGQAAEKGKTDYTAWFFAPEVGEWKLIASFRRPKSDAHLVRLHSFLENFYTEMGNQTRKVNFTNQWAYNTKGEWVELNRIKFTADATARKESRMDYAGGTEGKRFFLQNCGFFSETTLVDSFFERENGGVAPEIDFDALP